MNKATELRLKPNVANQASLPLSDNIFGDIRKVNDTGLLYVWRLNQSSGLLSSWEQITSAGGAGGGHTIETEGTPLTQRTKLNFIGGGVSVADNLGDDSTEVTILLESGHIQGTDQGLDTGGANAVTALEIKTGLNNINTINDNFKLTYVLPRTIDISSGKFSRKDVNGVYEVLVSGVTGQTLSINGNNYVYIQNSDNTLQVETSAYPPINAVLLYKIPTVAGVIDELNIIDLRNSLVNITDDYLHPKNADTRLGTVDADINMNTHKLTGLKVPDTNGDSIRATTKITEVNLEDAVDKKHRSIVNEIPTGDINGINIDFILTYTPIVGTVQVFLCGLLQSLGSGNDYIISGNIISFVVAPETGMEIRTIYDV